MSRRAVTAAAAVPRAAESEAGAAPGVDPGRGGAARGSRWPCAAVARASARRLSPRQALAAAIGVAAALAVAETARAAWGGAPGAAGRCGPRVELVEGVQKGDGSGEWAGADGWIDEAFVSFFDRELFELAEPVVAAVHMFSTRPVVVYCIDCELPWPASRYPRLVRRSMPYAPRSVFFNKLQAVLLSRVRHGVLIEADSIPNRRVDDLFDTVRRHAHLAYPLLPRHVRDPRNQGPFLAPGTRRSVPYGHAHLLWAPRALPFLRRAHEQCLDGRFDGANYDETAINVLLWESNATVQACLYDTHWHRLAASFARQREALKASDTTPYGPFSEPGQAGGHRYAAYLLVHGNKDPERAWEILSQLKREAARGSRVYVRDDQWFERPDDGWLLDSSTCVL